MNTDINTFEPLTDDHTKGEWKVTIDWQTGNYIIKAQAEDGHYYPLPVRSGKGVSGSEILSNVVLIAKAPKLAQEVEKLKQENAELRKLCKSISK